MALIATDVFYPDFVGKLRDGRTFAAEHKGALLAGTGNDDTNERRVIGKKREDQCGGKGLFVVVEKECAVGTCASK